MQPRVIDISHHNVVEDMHAVAASGIWGVIHKASQGSGYTDQDYARHRQMALDAGLEWGAYHFNDGSDIRSQVDKFMKSANPDDTTLLVLDFEDNPKSNMSPQQMVQFLRIMEQKVGHKIAIYSGNRLKENIGKLSVADRAYVCEHPLWLCQYGAQPKLPPGFSSTFLWQYSDGVVGPGPHGVTGVRGEVDLNAFNGTREELTAMWHGDANARRSPPSSHSARASEDQPPEPRTRPIDDTGDLPPFLRAKRTGGDVVNVQVPTAEYSIEVEVAQRELDAMGYHEVGDIDGYWGGKTAAGIKGFFIDRGLDDAAQMGPVLNNEIAKAKREGWRRPIAPSRANAQPKDIAPKVEAVRVSLWQKFGAQIAAAVAGLGFTGSTLSSAFSDVQSKLQPMHDAFSKIPPEVWFGIVGLTALAVWYGSTRAARAATKDYNTGRLN